MPPPGQKKPRGQRVADRWGSRAKPCEQRNPGGHTMTLNMASSLVVSLLQKWPFRHGEHSNEPSSYTQDNVKEDLEE